MDKYEQLNSYRTYVRGDRLKEFEKNCETNSLDPYNIAVTLGMHSVLRYLEWGDYFRLPNSKSKKLTPKEAMDKGVKSTEGYGISFSQANFIVQGVVRFAKTRGEEFKRWWNKVHGGTGKEDGVVISNMLEIDITKMK